MHHDGNPLLLEPVKAVMGAAVTSLDVAGMQAGLFFIREASKERRSPEERHLLISKHRDELVEI